MRKFAIMLIVLCLMVSSSLSGEKVEPLFAIGKTERVNKTTKLLKEQILYTQVRVKFGTDEGVTGGSGTVIYSAPKTKGSKSYSTYAITCHHVVADAIKLEDFFDPTLGKQRKRELRKKVTVEFFDYAPAGDVDRTYTTRADIMAYSEQHDMALIKLVSTRKYEYVAELYPKNQGHLLQPFHPVIAVGCALLHDPIPTTGKISHKGDVIDHAEYWMSDAQIIYGNSGGAIFTLDKLQFIGIPSRVGVVGWGNPVTHMGYFSPITRVYEFLDEQDFQFIYSDKVTEQECEKKRREKKEKALSE